MKYTLCLWISLMICSCGDFKDQTIDQNSINKSPNNNLPAYLMTNDTKKHKTKKAYLNYRGDIVLPIDLKDLSSNQKDGVYQPSTNEDSSCFIVSQKILSPNDISTIKVILDADINTQYTLGDTKDINQQVLDVRFEYNENHENFSQQCHFSTNKMQSKWLCTTKEDFQVYDASYHFQDSWTWKESRVSRPHGGRTNTQSQLYFYGFVMQPKKKHFFEAQKNIFSCHKK